MTFIVPTILTFYIIYTCNYTMTTEHLWYYDHENNNTSSKAPGMYDSISFSVIADYFTFADSYRWEGMCYFHMQQMMLAIPIYTESETSTIVNTHCLEGRGWIWMQWWITARSNMFHQVAVTVYVGQYAMQSILDYNIVNQSLSHWHCMWN